MSERASASSFTAVLKVFTRLGFTSFGGPVAHLGYFHDEFVKRRGWLDEASYADLVALCQFLPGPASSQVGIAIGMRRAGISGALAAWLGFTLPSAALLIAFAFGVTSVSGLGDAGWLQGLKIVAVAVVAHAVWGMAGKLTPDRPRVTVAIAAAIIMLLWPDGFVQLVLIVLGALLGLALHRSATPAEPVRPTHSFRRRWGATLLLIFAALLLLLPLAREATDSHLVAVTDSFYRAGSLVFGGGHVVLPLLQAEVVPPGWVDEQTFVAGYGAAQAVPGPLFTFAAYLGAAMQPWPGGLSTALAALATVFAPSFLLLLGVMPFWDGLRARPSVQAALKGVNAVVVGILLAALYDPVWTSAITDAGDVAIALAAFLLLSAWRWPAWLVVIVTVLLAAARSALV